MTAAISLPKRPRFPAAFTDSIQTPFTEVIPPPPFFLSFKFNNLRTIGKGNRSWYWCVIAENMMTDTFKISLTTLQMLQHFTHLSFVFGIFSLSLFLFPPKPQSLIPRIDLSKFKSDSHGGKCIADFYSNLIPILRFRQFFL